MSDGYFHDLLFSEPGECRLNIDDPRDVRLVATDAADMLTTHLRQLSGLLSDSCDDPPRTPSHERISSLLWTMDHLGGLLEVLRDIESQARKAEMETMTAPGGESRMSAASPVPGLPS